MDLADLHDHEIKKVGIVWKDVMDRYSRKVNNKTNLTEMAKYAHDEFLKIGLVVNVMWENTLIIDPRTMEPYPVEIEVIGRVPGTQFQEDGVDMFDHEFKRHEVLTAKERGEAFLGQKGRAN